MRTGLADREDGCLYCHRYTTRDFCSQECREAWWMDLNEQTWETGE